MSMYINKCNREIVFIIHLIRGKAIVKVFSTI